MEQSTFHTKVVCKKSMAWFWAMMAVFGVIYLISIGTVVLQGMGVYGEKGFKQFRLAISRRTENANEYTANDYKKNTNYLSLFCQRFYLLYSRTTTLL